MKSYIGIVLLILAIFTVASCDNFIDVTPDKTGTLQNAFRQKSKAKKFLFSIYAYLPKFGSLYSSVGFLGGDELWTPPDIHPNGMQIARGKQNVANPIFNYWDGQEGGESLYKGVRKANIFLKNIHKVGNMTQYEKDKWSAEVKFLKAYFYFYLIRMYGPVNLFKQNVPSDASNNKILVPRAPLDSCFAYVNKLLREVIASPSLPARIKDRQTNLGRVTKSIAYAVEAQVKVTQASPLFNGNTDFKGFTNVNGKNPFPTSKDPAKWDSAAAAAKRGVKFIESQDFKLYKYTKGVGGNISDTLQQQMTIRNSLTLGRGSSNQKKGIIWASPASAEYTGTIQNRTLPHYITSEYIGDVYGGWLAVPFRMAKLFYSDHGVPIKQDTSWNYANRFNLKKVGEKNRFYLKQGYKTAKFNFNREPRFYADLAGDGFIWYGNGVYDKNQPAEVQNFLKTKSGQSSGKPPQGKGYGYSVTGYFPKKFMNINTSIVSGEELNTRLYNWPVFRLSQLYLLYAEAMNEADGPSPEVYKYLNKVRKRAGIPAVQKAWNTYSNNPDQYKNKKGLRKIIHHETLIELAFEAHRFWDLRRWKEAANKFNNSIKGWNISQSSATGYYNKSTLFSKNFPTKEYLWPIKESDLTTNQQLTQNPGW